MAKYAILGHGGFDPTSGSYAPEVLVPPDTTLRFFSDAGQALVLPTAKGDYTKVASTWSQLKDQGSPIQAKGVTYNYTLYPDTTDAHRESAKAADWDGASVVFVNSGQAYLCTGTAETCPTPKLNVAASRHDELLARGDTAVTALQKWVAGAATGDLPTEITDFAPRITDVPAEYFQYVADGVPDERWKHHCDGILSQLGGSGHELSWIACTSIMIATPELPVLDTADVSGPGASDVSDWVPDDAAYKTIRELNAKNVKDTADGGTVSIVAGGAVVLIGVDHLRSPADYVRRQADTEEGRITVTKGGAFSKGDIKVTGISAKQAVVKSEIGEFSDKKVTFG